VLKESQPIIGPDGKPHTYMIDNSGNKVQDLGVHYEKPISISTGDASLDREATRLMKPYTTMTTQGAAKLDKIDEAKSLILGNAEAQALGKPETMVALVSGQGSGVRVTQSELNAILQARGFKGNIEAFQRQFKGEGDLTPTQQKQIAGILDDAKARLQTKLQIANDTQDAINAATSREQVIQAEKQGRKNLNDLEKFGHYEGETVNVGGKPVIIKKLNPDGTFEAD